MDSPGVQRADTLLAEGFAALCAAGENGRVEDLFQLCRIGTRAIRRAEQAMVGFAAALIRQGAFAERGMRSVNGLMDLLGVDHAAARRIVIAADHVTPRIGLRGEVLPPRLPGTAAAFTAGVASLQHVQTVAGLLNSAAAGRLAPEVAAEAERLIASHIGEYTPFELRNWGVELLDKLDQDGAEPDDRDPDPVNDLQLRPHPSGTGGALTGRFDDPALYDLIASVLDAKAKPRTADDRRPLGQRQAEALADVFAFVAEHGDRGVAPETAGRRPQVNVTVNLTDLENRARAACLDFAGIATPTALRMLCCDACVVPIVLGGSSQPLDVGRAQRVIPDGLRRAVIVRDRGCAHPGCDRPVSWAEIHHIVPWETGGDTKLSNLVMLCKVHHRQIHYSDWVVRIAPDGIPEFIPPLWIDPGRTPRRKPRPVDPTHRWAS